MIKTVKSIYYLFKIFMNNRFFIIFYWSIMINKRKVDICIYYTEYSEIKIMHLSYMFL